MRPYLEFPRIGEDSCLCLSLLFIVEFHYNTVNDQNALLEVSKGWFRRVALHLYQRENK